MKKFFNAMLKHAYKHVDKLLHILVAYALVITASVFNLTTTGLIVTIVLSIIKEIIDDWLYDRFSWGDLFSDLIGIALAYLVLWMGR